MPDLSLFKPKSSQGWLAWVLLFFIVLFSFASEQFLSLQNLLDLAETYAVTGIFALGLFVVLVTGGIDISFAAVASVVQYIIAALFVNLGFDNAPLSILLAILCGTLFGVINAVLIYWLRIVSIIITISMQALLFGLLMWITEGRSLYNLPEWWVTLHNVLPFTVNGQSYQIGLPLAIMLIITVITWLLLNKTHLGRQLYATGGDQESARRIGIRVGLIHILAYGYLGALAATVLGGADPNGGFGRVTGVVLALIALQILSTGFNLMNISQHFSLAMWGAVLIVVLGLKFCKTKLLHSRAVRRSTLLARQAGLTNKKEV